MMTSFSTSGRLPPAAARPAPRRARVSHHAAASSASADQQARERQHAARARTAGDSKRNSTRCCPAGTATARSR